MGHVFQGLDQFALVYIDDILIYSQDRGEHFLHVEKVLERLKRFNLKCKTKKYEWFQASTTFLGHLLVPRGIRPHPKYLTVIVGWTPSLRTVKQVQVFLGLTGFLKMFIRDYSKITVPLTDLTKPGTFYHCYIFVAFSKAGSAARAWCESPPSSSSGKDESFQEAYPFRNWFGASVRAWLAYSSHSASSGEYAILLREDWGLWASLGLGSMKLVRPAAARRAVSFLWAIASARQKHNSRRTTGLNSLLPPLLLLPAWYGYAYWMGK